MLLMNEFFLGKTSRPTQMKISRNKLIRIINEALYGHEMLKRDVLESFTEKMKTKRISYYRFMNFLVDSHTFREDFDLMEDLIGLYSFKNTP